MKVLFASDISLNWLAKAKEEKEVKALYRDVLPFFETADFSMVNMENIFGTPEEGEPIVKVGPNLIADRSFENILDALHPTVVNFANNHVGDYGQKLALKNFEACRKKGYLLTGCGPDLREAYRPVYLEKDGVRIGIIGACENEFGVADETGAGSAGYDLGYLNDSIVEVKEAGALPVVYFHGGNEFNPFPSPMKVALYRHLIDFGVKAVIAMHTHCPQGYEMYHGGAIVYSMGNFYFPRDKATYPSVANESWFYGYLAELEIGKDGVSLKTVPYHFDSDYIEVLQGGKLAAFEAYMQALNAPLSDSALIRKLFDSWCMLRGFDYIARAKYTDAMKTAKPEEVKLLRSIFTCEAHNELVRGTVSILFEQRTEEAEKYVEYIRKLQEMEL